MLSFVSHLAVISLSATTAVLNFMLDVFSGI